MDGNCVKTSPRFICGFINSWLQNFKKIAKIFEYRRKPTHTETYDFVSTCSRANFVDDQK